MAEPFRPRQVESVGPTGIYPASGPWPPGGAEVRGQGELGHPDEHRELARMARLERAERGALLLGRALFGGFFLYNGLNHFLQRKMMTGYAAGKHVPLPAAAVAGTGTLLVLGGLSILTGVRPKLGASLIGAFLLGVTPKMHDFWRAEPGERRIQEIVNFTKNVALGGGAALAAALPEPWPVRVRVTRQASLA